MVVDGKSEFPYCVALVIPDFVWTKGETCPTHEKWKNFSNEELCKNQEFIELLTGEMKKIGKQDGLNGFEIPIKLHLHDEAMTPENGLLTPTFKLQRIKVRKLFADKIDALYN